MDVEKRMQALVAKDRIRIKEFFIDFDKLRKGFVGEAGVSLRFLNQLHFVTTFSNLLFLVPNMHRHTPILTFRRGT